MEIIQGKVLYRRLEVLRFRSRTLKGAILGGGDILMLFKDPNQI